MHYGVRCCNMMYCIVLNCITLSPGMLMTKQGHLIYILYAHRRPSALNARDPTGGHDPPAAQSMTRKPADNEHYKRNNDNMKCRLTCVLTNPDIDHITPLTSMRLQLQPPLTLRWTAGESPQSHTCAIDLL